MSVAGSQHNVTTAPRARVYTRAQVYAALDKYWGYRELRVGQEGAVRAVLKGQDSLVILPTGSGKSLCFQLPAVVMGGLTVVISPLLALMKDQVDGLLANDYPAAAINSSLTDQQYSQVMADVDSGRIRLLYVSAKRAVMPGFTSLMRRLNPSAVVVDEAHCISQWGHDFVPEYRQLAILRESLPEASFHAFTATATPRVQQDICDQLHLRTPAMLIGTFDRPNLRYRVISRETHSRDERPDRDRNKRFERPQVPYAHQIADIIKDVRGGATIVYCIRRNDTELLADKLCELGVRARAYHAGLDDELRRQVQDEFIGETLHVVVATVAFGMGIDRPDVRCVVHANCPKTVEAYQQETGRAGRDGLPSECVMLFDASDVESWEYLIKQSAESVKESKSRQRIIKHGTMLLERMVQFATNSGRCRHRGLSEYFGQSYDVPLCGACDVCYSAARRVPHNIIGRSVLGVVQRNNQINITLLQNALRGQLTDDTLRHGLYTDPGFGTLASYSTLEVGAIIADLGGAGLLHSTADSTLGCTADGGMFLQSDNPLMLPCLSQNSPRTPVRVVGIAKRAAEEAKLSEQDNKLRTLLRGVRSRLAKRRGVAPFVLFDDTTLLALAKSAPRSPEALLKVPGLSAAKITEIGDDLLVAIEHFYDSETQLE